MYLFRQRNEWNIADNRISTTKRNINTFLWQKSNIYKDIGQLSQQVHILYLAKKL